MRSIYLDSNILISYYSTDPREAPKKKMVQRALDVFARARDVYLCTSIWALTETVNILISEKRMPAADVEDIEQRLFIESFGNLKLHFKDVSPDKNYDFDRFFYDVREAILKYHSGVGDVIHSVIMKNNGVDFILTSTKKMTSSKFPG
jgi:predicted nucleic acid-binding protein